MKTNKNTFRRVASLLLVVCFAVLALASCAQSTPNAADASGNFGDGIAWEYKKESKTLTITRTESGDGVLGDVSKDEDNAPWAGSVRLSAAKIVVGEGITSLGSYSLWGFSNVTEISLPSTLTKIGSYAFAYCGKLASINIPGAVTELGEGAFEGCSSLPTVFLPEGVRTVHANTFAYCSAMKSAIITGVPAEGSKLIESNVFKNCHSLEKLILRKAVEANPDSYIAGDAFANVDTAKLSKEYTDSPDGISTITIIYQIGEENLDGKTINGVVVKTYVNNELDLYEPVTVPSPTIPGYTADQLSISVTGDSVDRTFYVTYKADAPAETEPAPEENPEETPEEDEPKNPVLNIVIPIVIFVVVLSGIGVIAFFMIRSDKKKKGGKKGTPAEKKDKKEKK